MSGSITVSLPEDLYDQREARACAAARSVDE
jgi:hypothetical protein